MWGPQKKIPPWWLLHKFGGGHPRLARQSVATVRLLDDFGSYRKATKWFRWRHPPFFFKFFYM